MGVPLHTGTADKARAAIDDIRAAIGALWVFHASDLLTDSVIEVAVKGIEEQLIIIGGALDVATAPDDERIPILTLAEVVARSQRRAKPTLQLMQGGRS